MRRIVHVLIAAFAAVFGLGLALTAGPATAADDDLSAKREDDVRAVVSVDDDDPDDDPFDGQTGTHTQGQTNTGGQTANSHDATGDSNDLTNSRKTAVSRDRDHSRGDKTRDWTHDGGDRTRDVSQNHTNDGTRNDTR